MVLLLLAGMLTLILETKSREFAFHKNATFHIPVESNKKLRIDLNNEIYNNYLNKMDFNPGFMELLRLKKNSILSAEYVSQVKDFCCEHSEKETLLNKVTLKKPITVFANYTSPPLKAHEVVLKNKELNTKQIRMEASKYQFHQIGTFHYFETYIRQKNATEAQKAIDLQLSTDELILNTIKVQKSNLVGQKPKAMFESFSFPTNVMSPESDLTSAYKGFPFTVERHPRFGYFMPVIYYQNSEKSEILPYKIEAIKLEAMSKTLVKTFEFDIFSELITDAFKQKIQDQQLSVFYLGSPHEPNFLKEVAFYVKGTKFIFLNHTKDSGNMRMVNKPIDSIDVVAGHIMLITYDDQEIAWYDIQSNLPEDDLASIGVHPLNNFGINKLQILSNGKLLQSFKEQSNQNIVIAVLQNQLTVSTYLFDQSTKRFEVAYLGLGNSFKYFNPKQTTKPIFSWFQMSQNWVWITKNTVTSADKQLNDSFEVSITTRSSVSRPLQTPINFGDDQENGGVLSINFEDSLNMIVVRYENKIKIYPIMTPYFLIDVKNQDQLFLNDGKNKDQINKSEVTYEVKSYYSRVTINSVGEIDEEVNQTIRLQFSKNLSKTYDLKQGPQLRGQVPSKHSSKQIKYFSHKNEYVLGTENDVILQDYVTGNLKYISKYNSSQISFSNFWQWRPFIKYNLETAARQEVHIYCFEQYINKVYFENYIFSDGRKNEVFKGRWPINQELTQNDYQFEDYRIIEGAYPVTDKKIMLQIKELTYILDLETKKVSPSTLMNGVCETHSVFVHASMGQIMVCLYNGKFYIINIQKDLSYLLKVDGNFGSIFSNIAQPKWVRIMHSSFMQHAVFVFYMDFNNQLHYTLYDINYDGTPFASTLIDKLKISDEIFSNLDIFQNFFISGRYLVLLSKGKDENYNFKIAYFTEELEFDFHAQESLPSIKFSQHPKMWTVKYLITNIWYETYLKLDDPVYIRKIVMECYQLKDMSVGQDSSSKQYKEIKRVLIIDPQAEPYERFQFVQLPKETYEVVALGQAIMMSSSSKVRPVILVQDSVTGLKQIIHLSHVTPKLEIGGNNSQSDSLNKNPPKLQQNLSIQIQSSALWDTASGGTNDSTAYQLDFNITAKKYFDDFQVKMSARAPPKENKPVETSKRALQNQQGQQQQSSSTRVDVKPGIINTKQQPIQLIDKHQRFDIRNSSKFQLIKNQNDHTVPSIQMKIDFNSIFKGNLYTQKGVASSDLEQILSLVEVQNYYNNMTWVFSKLPELNGSKIQIDTHCDIVNNIDKSCLVIRVDVLKDKSENYVMNYTGLPILKYNQKLEPVRYQSRLISAQTDEMLIDMKKCSSPFHYKRFYIALCSLMKSYSTASHSATLRIVDINGMAQIRNTEEDSSVFLNKFVPQHTQIQVQGNWLILQGTCALSGVITQVKIYKIGQSTFEASDGQHITEFSLFPIQEFSPMIKQLRFYPISSSAALDTSLLFMGTKWLFSRVRTLQIYLIKDQKASINENQWKLFTFNILLNTPEGLKSDYFTRKVELFLPDYRTNQYLNKEIGYRKVPVLLRYMGYNDIIMNIPYTMFQNPSDKQHINFMSIDDMSYVVLSNPFIGWNTYEQPDPIFMNQTIVMFRNALSQTYLLIYNLEFITSSNKEVSMKYSFRPENKAIGQKDAVLPKIEHPILDITDMSEYLYKAKQFNNYTSLQFISTQSILGFNQMINVQPIYDRFSHYPDDILTFIGLADNGAINIFNISRSLKITVHSYQVASDKVTLDFQGTYGTTIRLYTDFISSNFSQTKWSSMLVIIALYPAGLICIFLMFFIIKGQVNKMKLEQIRLQNNKRFIRIAKKFQPAKKLLDKRFREGFVVKLSLVTFDTERKPTGLFGFRTGRSSLMSKTNGRKDKELEQQEKQEQLNKQVALIEEVDEDENEEQELE